MLEIGSPPDFRFAVARTSQSPFPLAEIVKISRMKKILIVLTFIPIISLFSQTKSTDTIFIGFNEKLDKHFNTKGKIEYFQILLNSKRFVDFQYGTQNGILINQEKPKKPYINRTELTKIITNDSQDKKIIYIVVKQNKKLFTYYYSDHIFRKIECK